MGGGNAWTQYWHITTFYGKLEGANVIIHLESCFWPPDEWRVKHPLSFNSVVGLIQHLRAMPYYCRPFDIVIILSSIKWLARSVHNCRHILDFWLNLYFHHVKSLMIFIVYLIWVFKDISQYMCRDKTVSYNLTIATCIALSHSSCKISITHQIRNYIWRQICDIFHWLFKVLKGRTENLAVIIEPDNELSCYFMQVYPLLVEERQTEPCVCWGVMRQGVISPISAVPILW